MTLNALADALLPLIREAGKRGVSEDMLCQQLGPVANRIPSEVRQAAFRLLVREGVAYREDNLWRPGRPQGAKATNGSAATLPQRAGRGLAPSVIPRNADPAKPRGTGSAIGSEAVPTQGGTFSAAAMASPAAEGPQKRVGKSRTGPRRRPAARPVHMVDGVLSKACSACERTLPLEQFQPKSGRCKACQREYNVRWRAKRVGCAAPEPIPPAEAAIAEAHGQRICIRCRAAQDLEEFRVVRGGGRAATCLTCIRIARYGAPIEREADAARPLDASPPAPAPDSPARLDASKLTPSQIDQIAHRVLDLIAERFSQLFAAPPDTQRTDA